MAEKEEPTNEESKAKEGPVGSSDSPGLPDTELRKEPVPVVTAGSEPLAVEVVGSAIGGAGTTGEQGATGGTGAVGKQGATGIEGPPGPQGEPPKAAAPGQLTVSRDTATAGEVIQQQSSNQDYIVLRYAVLGLMVTIWIALVGVILLAYQSKEAPDGVIAAGSAAIGALATMIVRPPLFPPKS